MKNLFETKGKATIFKLVNRDHCQALEQVLCDFGAK